MSHSGSCLCGEVRFTVEGELGEIGHCHCLMCQKMHGAAFGTYVTVDLDHLHFDVGESNIEHYRSSPTITRSFCRICGSTLMFSRDGAATTGVAAGCFDTELGSTVSYEIWTGVAANWGHRDNIPMTDEGQPGKIVE